MYYIICSGVVNIKFLRSYIMNSNFESFRMHPDQIKKKILRDGIWEPYTERIKNLEKAQEKLWELHDSNCNVDDKRKILEDIVNLQPVIADWYSSSMKIIELEGNCGVCK